MSHGADNFYTSDKVVAQKVLFNNQYKMKVAGNLFIPKGSNPNVKAPAIIVGHPMGAVKEQSANLYAQKLAEQGLSPCRWTCRFGARAKACRVTPFHRISTPKTSAPQWTS